MKLIALDLCINRFRNVQKRAKFFSSKQKILSSTVSEQTVLLISPRLLLHAYQ